METLLSILAGTAIAAMLIPTVGLMIQKGQDRQVQAVTAGEFQDLLSASRNYVDGHYSDLASTIAVGGALEIPLNLLPLLPNFSQQNPYGQTWHVYVEQPSSNELNAVVTSWGGQTLGLSALTRISALGGSHAGFIGADNVVPNVNSQTAIGANGGWRMALGGTPVNPGAGHLFGLASGTAGSQYNSDTLYRDNVPNHPELNTMNATLNMGGNNIAAASDIAAQTGHYSGNIGTNGIDPYALPPGWGGGVNSWDVYARGTVGAGTSEGANAWMSNSGAGYFKTNLQVGQKVTANQVVLPSGNSLQIGGQYFYGDGSNAAVRTPGTFFLQHPDGSAADGHLATLYTEQGVRLSGTGALGGGCVTGSITAQNDGSGALLSCVNGIWKSTTRPPIGYYVPKTSDGNDEYDVINPYTGGFSCQAGSTDMQSATLWYGSYGYSALHLCIAQ